MKAGITMGVSIFLIGVAMTVIGYTSYAAGGTFKVLLFGPVFILVGVSMCILPGSDYTNKDLRAKDVDGKDIIYKASLKAKIIWILAGTIGFIISTVFRDVLTNFF